jgi:hypothetical protein
MWLYFVLSMWAEDMQNYGIGCHAHIDASSAAVGSLFLQTLETAADLLDSY